MSYPTGCCMLCTADYYYNNDRNVIGDFCSNKCAGKYKAIEYQNELFSNTLSPLMEQLDDLVKVLKDIRDQR